MTPITLKPDTTILDATIGRFEDRPMKYEIDSYCDGTIYVYGEEFGPRLLIVGCRSWEAALDCAYDCLPTIPEEEIPEAYGFDGWRDGGYDITQETYSPETAKARFEAALAAAERGERDYPELIEGYHYQSNASGTGIVSVSDYEWLRPLEKSDLEEYGIKLTIGRVDLD